MAKDIYDIGEAPPLGEIPKKMWAQLIRPERFGEPKDAFKVEQVEVPEVGPGRRPRLGRRRRDQLQQRVGGARRAR